MMAGPRDGNENGRSLRPGLAIRWELQATCCHSSDVKLSLLRKQSVNYLISRPFEIGSARAPELTKDRKDSDSRAFAD